MKGFLVNVTSTYLTFMNKLYILLLIIININVNSQVSQEWERFYNGPGNLDDIGSFISKDNSGNIYVCGTTNNYFQIQRILILKYNPSGELIWQQIFTSSDSLNNYPCGMVLDNSGNICIGGNISGRFLTIKYNSNGVLQWSKRYGGITFHPDVAYAIAVDNNNNVYLTGRSYLDTSYVLSTVKYDESGNQIWAARYNCVLEYYSNRYYIGTDGSNNVFVASDINSGTSIYPDWDYVTIKYNSAGVQQWVIKYNDAQNSADYLSALVVEQSGNSFVTGTVTSTFPNYSICTVKYNTNGIQQWISKYSGTGNYVLNEGTCINLDLNNNVLVTGYSERLGAVSQYVTLKYNNSGVQQWVKLFEGSSNNFNQPYNLKIDVQGNSYIAGGAGNVYSMFKYNTQGDLMWSTSYTATTYHPAICLDGQNIYLTGSKINNDPDCVTLKYIQVIGIQPVSSEIPENYNLSQNYPNPFNPSTTIKFDLPKTGIVKVSIYDILGKEVAVLVNENVNVGTFKVDWDASNYPSGIYFYKLESGTFSQIKKMILVK